VLLLLTFGYTLNFIDRNLLNVIQTPLINHFHLDDTTYGFLNGPPFALFYAVMGIPIAMLADRMNRVVVVALAISVWSVMAAMCGIVDSFAFLLFCRVGVAIGEAGGTPPSNSLIGDYFKPKSRAHALGIFSMGVTVGSALSNFFGGPIAQNLSGTVLKKFFTENHWDFMLGLTDWDKVEGWRVAFVLTGAPGIVFAILLLLTCKEPPRGFSDPPGTVKPERIGMMQTLREAGPKLTFWTAALAASLTALVGYGLTGFQAAWGGRMHGISPGDFAWNYGGPLALFSAFGTFMGGLVIDRISHKWQNAVAWVPGIGLLIAIPLYIYAWHLPTSDVWVPGPDGKGGHAGIALYIYGIGAMFHYAYLTSQYTISQGVVGQRSRASAVAIMLLMVALIGNGIGPQIVGWISDMQMQHLISADPLGVGLKAEQCRLLITGKPNFTPGYEATQKLVSAAQLTLCKAKYGEGVRDAMTYTSLIFIAAAGFWFWSSLTLKKDMIAKPV
jgi:MFS family permease